MNKHDFQFIIKQIKILNPCFSFGPSVSTYSSIYENNIQVFSIFLNIQKNIVIRIHNNSNNFVYSEILFKDKIIIIFRESCDNIFPKLPKIPINIESIYLDNEIYLNSEFIFDWNIDNFVFTFNNGEQGPILDENVKTYQQITGCNVRHN